MKTIKFRQRNKNNGQFRYWGLVDDEWVMPLAQDNYVTPEESDQYTGLLDKNGVDIYEGDIINDFGGGTWVPCENEACEHKNHKTGHYVAEGDTTRLGVIEFAEGFFGVKTKEMSYTYIPTPKGSSKKWEVLGNIYEHPHLLTNSI